MTVLGATTGAIEVPAAGGALLVTWAGATDVGRRRAVNEDSAVVVPPVFAVADGMGGHAAGDRASALAVESLEREARAASALLSAGEPVDPEALVRRALGAAAEAIDELSDEVGSAGTTVTGLVLEAGDAPAFVVFNLGDSRVYSLTGHELRRETRDHSLVQDLVDSGALSEEDAEAHPDSNVITRALGFHEEPDPDLGRVPLRPGLRMLLCSDGLTKEVDAVHLRLLLGSGLGAEVTASALVDAALASGGRDNVTVLVVDVKPAIRPSSLPRLTN